MVKDHLKPLKNFYEDKMWPLVTKTNPSLYLNVMIADVTHANSYIPANIRAQKLEKYSQTQVWTAKQKISLQHEMPEL